MAKKRKTKRKVKKRGIVILASTGAMSLLEATLLSILQQEGALGLQGLACEYRARDGRGVHRNVVQRALDQLNARSLVAKCDDGWRASNQGLRVLEKCRRMIEW